MKKKIKYEKLDNEFIILDSCNIYDLTILIVKDWREIKAIEKESWVIIFHKLTKEKIKDNTTLCSMLEKYIEVNIYLNDWFDYIKKMIESQKQKSWSYIIY